MALRKAWVTVVGWLLVVIGLLAIPFPGPGILILLAGLVLLSREYAWAERRAEPVRRKAISGVKQSVSTYPRLLLTAASATAVVLVGVWVYTDPTIPRVGPVGPRLPFGFGGPATGASIIFSGVLAWGLLAYSVKRYRREAVDERRAVRAARAGRGAGSDTGSGSAHSTTRA